MWNLQATSGVVRLGSAVRDKRCRCSSLTLPARKADHIEPFVTRLLLDDVIASECYDIVCHHCLSYLGNPFSKQVGDPVTQNPQLPLNELAGRAHQPRQKADCMSSSKMKMRHTLRHAGLRFPGIRNSA
jgi:hypothetical protein